MADEQVTPVEQTVDWKAKYEQLQEDRSIWESLFNMPEPKAEPVEAGAEPQEGSEPTLETYPPEDQALAAELIRDYGDILKADDSIGHYWANLAEKGFDLEEAAEITRLKFKLGSDNSPAPPAAVAPPEPKPQPKPEPGYLRGASSVSRGDSPRSATPPNASRQNFDQLLLATAGEVWTKARNKP